MNEATAIVPDLTVAPGDPAYPIHLCALPVPPVLHVRGTLAREDALAVAIVGSRRATAYGLAVAETLAHDLAARGVTIVSGLARGIDAAAHRGALAAGGRTLAVLGSGLDRVYPPENRALAAEIARHGALLSQFPAGTPPLPHHFPRRNAVIAALALGTGVVEAAESSGALITAGLAGEFGRLVFAVPGRTTSDLSRGTNGLIRDGATLVRDWIDVVDELPMMWRECVRLVDDAPKATGAMPSGDEGVVLTLLGEDPLAIERLIAAGGLGPGRTSAALVNLEVQGWARQVPGQRYVRSG
jgi:DNA processing protein